MKLRFTFSVLLFISTGVIAQTNTFPATGNVGIGTTTPNRKLTVLGDLAALNPNNIDAVAFLGWLSDVARLRVGGSGIGRENGLDVQGHGDESLMRILGNGNVGIGTTTPNAKLAVNGNIVALNPNNSSATASFSWLNDIARIRIGGSGNGANNGLDIQRYSDVSLMRILGNGNVGIGTTVPTEKLAVNGNIRAKEVKVETANWPDYVFADDYKLPDLEETEAFIKTHKHLPGMPTAIEVKAQGVSLGEMNRKLLEKAEELTLHLIEKEKNEQQQNERIDKLEKFIKALLIDIDESKMTKN